MIDLNYPKQMESGDAATPLYRNKKMHIETLLYFQQPVPNNKYLKKHSLSFQGKVTLKALA